MSLLHHNDRDAAFDFTSHFRDDFYGCLRSFSHMIDPRRWSPAS